MAKPKKDLFAERLAALSCQAIDSNSIHIDWSEARGNDGEGFRSFEAVKCQECGAVLVLDGGGNEKHCDAAPYDGDAHTEVDCEGYLDSADGPMMNYYYPVDIDNCEEAARKLADLSLCVVEFSDGRTGLALTGGGMNMTWSIVKAFLAIGCLPPVAFTRLPAFADKTFDAETKFIVAACIRSNEVAQRSAQGNIDDIKRTVAWMRKDARKRAKGGR